MGKRDKTKADPGLAEDKKTGVETQKEEQSDTPKHKDWYWQEKERFPAKSQFSPVKKLQLRVSNHALDLKDTFKANMSVELDTGLAFNLVPVFLAIGIITYFSAPAEPSIFALLGSVIALSILVWRLQIQTTLYWLLSALSLMLAGMFVAQLATLNHQTPILERQITAPMIGYILGVDQNRRGAPRYFVKPVKIEGLDQSQLPRRIRVSATAKHEELLPGDTIQGLARLQPVAGPVYPGGYDFSFFAFHEGMGGSGFFMGRPQKGETLAIQKWSELFVILINRMRIAVEKRLVAAMPYPTGGIAVALVTGNKTQIPEDIQESLRKTGLAHILAISGLHMALVTLTVVWSVRFILVNISNIALYYPIKKWAVGAGFISATTYLMLSGAGIATQRAWVMISVMLLAVLMDRRAITMRSVAVSAIIILTLNPQSVFSPGFQMSFAAVTALVAGYEYLNQRRRENADNSFGVVSQNRFLKIGNGIMSYAAGIATTSLIAGTATAFIAAWHFHQVANYGLFANLLAMPIVSILIMPFVLFSILLMPYGLEFLPLGIVAHGIEWVVDISKWVEGFSPNGTVGLMGRGSLLIFAGFLIWLCFFKTRLRFLAFLPFLALPFFMKEQIAPDVLISENGRAIAVKTETGKLGFLYPRASQFVHGIWAKAWSGGTPDKLGLSKQQCNRKRCISVLANSKIMHVVYDPALLASSCQRADVLIAPRLWWVKCEKRKPELILSRYEFERYGTHALYIRNVTTNAARDNTKLKAQAPSNEIYIETSFPQSSRYWHRQVTHPDKAKNLF